MVFGFVLGWLCFLCWFACFWLFGFVDLCVLVLSCVFANFGFCLILVYFVGFVVAHWLDSVTLCWWLFFCWFGFNCCLFGFG